MKQIIVNATAARTSGALTILKDFMSFVYAQNDKHYIFHLLTTTQDIFHNEGNIFVHEISSQNWRTRLLWDRSGFQNWLVHISIVPYAVVSFQNTCPRLTGVFRDVKLLVYYHQQLPLVKYQWKWHRSDERKLFLYAHFYGFFVNRWNKKAEYVVQLPHIKQLFCAKFKNINPERVHVIRSNLPKIDVNSVPAKEIYKDKKVFIFPATPLRYKNHIAILRALNYLKKEDFETFEQIRVIFTVSKISFIAQNVHEMELGSVVDCIENIPYEELLSYYKRSDALLFPSKIESLGLPLVEAAMFGIPVVAADLPYAREVLEDYKSANFVDADDYVLWAEKIKQIMLIDNKKVSPLQGSSENTWTDFLDLLNRKCKNG
ncbi:MAG: glycosyltransferase family 4 protein [Treponema sp.]|nr:glycosyltransferase family 4 protein [Treponema sp.]